MNFKDLDIGDVFKVTDHPTVFIRPDKLWRKESPRRARAVEADAGTPALSAADLRDGTIEVVERAGIAPAIARSGDTLILHGGDVLLDRLPPFTVYRCTPGEPFTEIVLSGASFAASATNAITSDTALPFSIRCGAQALGRPGGSMVFAYRGRAYARATSQEVTGKKAFGGYRRFLVLDGARRLAIAGLLTIAEDGALFDIIQDHFGAMVS
jgi:hypothetical protein